MNTLTFVKNKIDKLNKERGWLEPDIDNLRDFVSVGCWSSEQMLEIHLAFLQEKEGKNYQYWIVEHLRLGSYLILVAKNN